MTSASYSRNDAPAAANERPARDSAAKDAPAPAGWFTKLVLSLALVAAVVLLVVAFPGQLSRDPGSSFAVLLFGLLRVAADLVPLHGRRERLAEGTAAVDFALILLVGPGGATMAAGLAATVRTLVDASREQVVHPLITIARAVLVVGTAGLVYDVLTGGRAGANYLAVAPAVCAAGLAYLAVDLLLAVVALAPAERRALVRGLVADPWVVFAQYAGLLAFGGLGAAVYSFSPVACLILGLPVGVAHYALREAMVARRAIRGAIESLAAEIDGREAYTAEHSERCALYARRICNALRLGTKETDLIVGVARIHDLGKMNIWPEMLNKAGPLDEVERLEMNRHPAYGAEILADFVDYRDAAAIILHHHERYDGKGYPAGLKGEHIPLGSRVVGVVDAFDAMTSHRPYRGALSFEHAVAELQANAGRQFDPQVVAAFVSTVGPADVPRTAGVRPLTRATEQAAS